jgi:hypothetical protein
MQIVITPLRYAFQGNKSLSLGYWGIGDLGTGTVDSEQGYSWVVMSHRSVLLIIEMPSGYLLPITY